METIAVIFGGRSAEHDISVITALGAIIKPLELTKKYHVEAVYISKDGAWYWDDKLKDISLFSGGGITDFLHKSSPASVQFDGGMTLVKASGIAGRKRLKKVDIVFPAMHGTYGEDGALMGLLDMAGIPYVGCGVSAAAIAMDKVFSKEIALSNNIPTPKSVHFLKDHVEKSPAAAIKLITDTLSYPVFIKPAHLGSSIGITRAENDKELRNGLEVAMHYDNKVLVEEAVNNLIEVTLPIMGNTNVQTALLERPLTTSEDFFDFDTKYINQGGKKGGGKKGGGKGAQGYSELPAKLPDALYKKAEDLGITVFKTFGCSGISRVDMLIDSKSETVYFNEINPMPGSLYAHNWNRAGVSTVELVDKLVALAKERYSERQSLNTTFQTNFLQQF